MYTGETGNILAHTYEEYEKINSNNYIPDEGFVWNYTFDQLKEVKPEVLLLEDILLLFKGWNTKIIVDVKYTINMLKY